MKAGFGKFAITPPLGVELSGYGYYLQRRAAFVQDELYARVLALQADTGEDYLLLSCDALGLSRPIVDSLREKLSRAYGLPADHLAAVCVHTHTGPSMVNHEGCGVVDPEYVKTVPDALFAACGAALADLTPVTSMTFTMQQPEQCFAYNRSTPGGPVEKRVRAFRLQREGAAPIALYSFGCHAVCRGRSAGVSADYPGEVCRLAEAKGERALFLNGLCGDIDPVPCPDGEREALLRALAASVLSAGSGADETLPCTVSGGRLTMQLHLQTITREAIAAVAAQASTRPDMIAGADKVARVWKETMLEKYDTLTDTEDFTVSYLCLGGIYIAALPFEGFTEIGTLLRETLNDARTVALGCAEAVYGYLPTRGDFERGTYAALESVFLYHRLPVLPGEAERIGTQLGERLRALRD